MSDRRLAVKDHAPEALRERFAALGLPRYRADQLATWIYRHGVEDPERMSDLPAGLRARLGGDLVLRALEPVSTRRGQDGTELLLLRADDGAVVETVVIPEERRTTVCISTQVGCPLACSFCATGALGFTRNLRTSEIVDQVLRARERLASGRGITNLVFMGMGEPLLNLPAVLEAIRIFTDPRGLAFAPRRITVSTAGVVPRIGELLDRTRVNLAVSLHATRDEVRDELVPLNRRFPLDLLLRTLAGHPQVSRRRPVFFEYTLMRGVNDSDADARRLVRILRRLPSKLNLIPMNPHPDAPHLPPDPERTQAFLARVAEAGVTVTLRRPRGVDIDAACGQLALRSLRDRAAVPA